MKYGLLVFIVFSVIASVASYPGFSDHGMSLNSRRVIWVIFTISSICLCSGMVYLIWEIILMSFRGDAAF